MALPKRKISKARRGSRRSHLALTAIQLKNCPKCGSKIKPHSTCKTCNNYIK